jgi:hypothetical protein
MSKKIPAPTPEMVEELTLAVNSLTDQVRMLRQAVDEIGDELGWAIRNRVIPELLPPVIPITSMPVDPLADDFCQRVNEVPREISPSAATKQGSLW